MKNKSYYSKWKSFSIIIMNLILEHEMHMKYNHVLNMVLFFIWHTHLYRYVKPFLWKLCELSSMKYGTLMGPVKVYVKDYYY